MVSKPSALTDTVSGWKLLTDVQDIFLLGLSLLLLDWYRPGPKLNTNARINSGRNCLPLDCGEAENDTGA